LIWCTIGPQIHPEARINPAKSKAIALGERLMVCAGLMGVARSFGACVEVSGRPEYDAVSAEGRDRARA
jgi:hypothetical protein